MGHNFNEIDIWMMARSKDIKKIFNSYKELVVKFDNLIERRINDNIDKLYDNFENMLYEGKESYDYSNEKHLFRDKWKLSDEEWDFISLCICGYNYKYLELNDNKPYIGIWIKRIKKLDVDYEEVGKKIIKNIKNMKYKYDDNYICRTIEFPSLDDIKNENINEMLEKIDDSMLELKNIADILDETLKDFSEITKRLKL